MKPIIVINAGHGGSQLGARSVTGEYEKDINLEVVKYFKELAEDYKDNFTFLYTRLDDKKISLDERVYFANQNQANLYISVHHNAYNGKATGSEIIHSIYGGGGQKVAEIMMNEFTNLGQNKRRIFTRRSNVDSNRDYYFEIAYTNMIAIISEYAFIDSEDFYDIDSQEERKAQAKAILRAILKYYNVTEKEDKKEELIPQWKLNILDEGYKNGLFTDYEGWKQRIDNPLSTWAVIAMINNTLKTKK